MCKENCVNELVFPIVNTGNIPGDKTINIRRKHRVVGYALVVVILMDGIHTITIGNI